MIHHGPLSHCLSLLTARRLLITILLLLTAHCSLLTGYGQTGATLSGTVEDENGAVVPNASVAAADPAKGIRRQATTNEQGYFTILLLPPSTYTVTVESKGFAPVQIDNVTLNVGDQKALQIQLKTGSITEMVKITDEPPLINESPAVGTVVDRQFVGNLPLNGRSFQSLITLSPGVVLTRTDGNTPGQFSVNGQRSDANYFTVDGVSANIGVSAANTLSQTANGSQPGFTVLGGTNNLASVDAVQEFKILTSTYAPEFGRSPGAQVSLATRSGTNDFHGAVFDYLRNEKLDANDWFVNRSGGRKPPLRQNDFGGVLGGPIIKNKTFFFFSYEGLRIRQPQFATLNVPSLNLRQTAPAAVQPILNAFPLPGATDPVNATTELAAISRTWSNPASLDATSLRIDHNVSNNVTLFGRYNEAPSVALPRSATNPAAITRTEFNTRTFTAGTTYLISATVTNEFRFNWSSMTGKSFGYVDNFGGAVTPDNAILFPSFASPETDQIVPLLAFGGNPQFRVGRSANNRQEQLNFVDNTSIASGPHQIKFGFDYRHLSPEYGPQNYFQQLIFTSAAGVRANSIAQTFILAGVGARPRYQNFAVFGQDTWKARPRLTLTYGLRWDVNPAPREADGKQPFTAINLTLAAPATATLAPPGTPLYNTYHRGFAPRIGAAFLAREKKGWELMMRGGWGIFFDLGNNQASQGFTKLPFVATKNVFGSPFPLTAANAAPPPFTFTTPYGEILSFASNLKLPRVYQFSFALEQSLGHNQTLSATYVGAQGRDLLRQAALRGVNSTFGWIDFTDNSGKSDYHALQIQFYRPLSRRFQALASYTWAHSNDNASTDDRSFDLPKADSIFDVRHTFNASVTYDLPSPRSSEILKAMFSNWSIDGSVSARTAAPVNILARSTFITGFAGLIQNIRPNVVPGVPFYLFDPSFPGGKRINPAAFTMPACTPGAFSCTPTAQGNLPRNALRGFALAQLDLSVRRQVKITERLKLLVRADFFNLFNHPNFGDQGSDFATGGFSAIVFSSFSATGVPVANPTFGLSPSMFGRSLGNGGINGGFSALYQVGGPRSTQVSLKFIF